MNQKLKSLVLRLAKFKLCNDLNKKNRLQYKSFYGSDVMELMTMRKLILILVGIFFSLSAVSETLFEGYYKVTQFKKHIGFAIIKNEVDAKTKNFKTTFFLRLGKNGFDMTESTQTISDTDLMPISYSYLGAEGKKTKTIDATFKKGKMTAQVSENGKKSKIEKTLPKGTFLSSVLYYLMMKSKDGLKTDTKYDFQAVAEENAEISSGSAVVDKKMVTEGTLQLLKVKNKFAGSEYENLITDRGEVISANTPATGIETELMKSPEEALEGIKVSNGTLEKIFGEMPAGKINVYHSKEK